MAEKSSHYENISDQYYSAELTVKGLDLIYQFKLRNLVSKSTCVLVRQDSNLLPWLKTGDIFNVKYYSKDSSYPPHSIETQIRDITKDEHGKYGGHYLVCLKIMKEPR